MTPALNVTDDNQDKVADEVIQSCFDLKSPKSFFLFAGAGSGKTRSLVSALEYINANYGRALKLSDRKVAVITYTKAARDEIKRRTRYNSLFEISTIHSFAWNLICAHTSDIRNFLEVDISEKIKKADEKLATIKSRSTRTYANAIKKREELQRRVAYLASIKHFIYNPDGVNIENDSLDHAEVIKITAALLSQKDTLQKILVDKYPILLIDESQDTTKDLMNIFIQIQQKYSYCFSLGLFGDIMQKIYLDGKNDWSTSIPNNWETPVKVMNHRSQKRIVDLCNSIRKPIDGIEQRSRIDKPAGFVRIFVSPPTNKHNTENSVLTYMSKITGDVNWENTQKVKTLTLEHKMAAERLGFSNFYEALDMVPAYRQGLKDGSLSVIAPLTHILLPMYKAELNNNLFEKTRIVKQYALIYKKEAKRLNDTLLSRLQFSIEKLSLLWKNASTTCKELLKVIYDEQIFQLPKDLEQLFDNPPLEGDESYEKISNLSHALESPFSEVERYWEYVNGEANFDTHQGVKGLEFERVLVIIDDSTAHGNTFNYGKLFGVEPKSATDKRNELEGKETTLDRTRRLLYVTCSRAKDSLAIVYYTDKSDETVSALSSTGWFSENEIQRL